MLILMLMILIMIKMMMVIMMIKMVDDTADDDGNDGADRGDTDVDADADDHENMDNDTTEHDDADNNDANDDTMTEGYNSNTRTNAMIVYTGNAKAATSRNNTSHGQYSPRAHTGGRAYGKMQYMIYGLRPNGMINPLSGS